jgi:hypothetical protein
MFHLNISIQKISTAAPAAARPMQEHVKAYENLLQQFNSAVQNNQGTIILDSLLSDIHRLLLAIKDVPQTVRDDQEYWFGQLFDLLATNNFSLLRIMWKALVPAVFQGNTVIHHTLHCNPLHFIAPWTPVDVIDMFVADGVNVNGLDGDQLVPLQRLCGKYYRMQLNGDGYKWQNHYLLPPSAPRRYRVVVVDLIDTIHLAHAKVQVLDFDPSIMHTTPDNVPVLRRMVQQHKAKLTVQDGHSLLSAAINFGDLICVRALLELGADRDAIIENVTIDPKTGDRLLVSMPYLLLCCLVKRRDLIHVFDHPDLAKRLSMKVGDAIYNNGNIKRELLFDHLHNFLSQISGSMISLLLKHRELWSLQLLIRCCQKLNIEWVRAILLERPDFATAVLLRPSGVATAVNAVTFAKTKDDKARHCKEVIFDILCSYGVNPDEQLTPHNQLPLQYFQKNETSDSFARLQEICLLHKRRTDATAGKKTAPSLKLLCKHPVLKNVHRTLSALDPVCKVYL